jgi:hypothetical protein
VCRGSRGLISSKRENSPCRPEGGGGGEGVDGMEGGFIALILANASQDHVHMVKIF